MSPCRTRMHLYGSGRETDWPQLWPVKEASGVHRLVKPEWLDDKSDKNQSWAKKMPKAEESVEASGSETLSTVQSQD